MAGHKTRRESQIRMFTSNLLHRCGFAALMLLMVVPGFSFAARQNEQRLEFEGLPDLPDPVGVAGPVVGFHDVDAADPAGNFVIVAGGANFAAADDPDLWSLPKLYHDKVHVLERDGDEYRWNIEIAREFKLSQPVGYSSVVNTKWGVLVIGGRDASGPSSRAFLLGLEPDGDSWRLFENDDAVPDLPLPATEGGAAVVDGYVYVVGGAVVVHGESAASRYVWRLRLDAINPGSPDPDAVWEPVVSWPEEGPRRMMPLVIVQPKKLSKRSSMPRKKYRASCTNRMSRKAKCVCQPLNKRPIKTATPI